MTNTRLRAADLVTAIRELPRNREYAYAASTNRGRILIDAIDGPEGPIWVKRYNPSKGEAKRDARRSSISVAMLWRVANAIRADRPFNIDRILAGSYNTRSVLETLLAYCPQFHFCHPGRIEVTESTQVIQRGHKHLIWLPDQPHVPGIHAEVETNVVIAEHSVETVYEAIDVPRARVGEMDIEVVRRHAQIQIALVLIGGALGCRSYIARNDQGIVYGERPIAELKGVVTDLASETILTPFPDAAAAGAFIDCVWFRGQRFMPAVMEVEHSTGVTTGLARMQSFKDKIPPFETRYVIVAPDEDRDLVFDRASEEQFDSLRPLFFPYSAVEELHWFTTRRKIEGLSDQIIDAFLEPVRH